MREVTGSKQGYWTDLGRMLGRSRENAEKTPGEYWEDPGRLLGVGKDIGKVLGVCWWETRGR